MTTRYAPRGLALARNQVTISLPPALRAELESRAEERGLSRSAQLTRDLERYYLLLRSASGASARLNDDERDAISALGEGALGSLKRFTLLERVAILDEMTRKEK